MNKLKKLFSPSALAATAATAMLISSAVTALAGDDVSASVGAPFTQVNCNGHLECSGVYNPGPITFYWCCYNVNNYCTTDVTYVGGTYYGWCSLTP